jgi:hypothetical protein
MTANAEYGFAIYVSPIESETLLFAHEGRMPGSGTLYVHAPETGITVLTMSSWCPAASQIRCLACLLVPGMADPGLLLAVANLVGERQSVSTTVG